MKWKKKTKLELIQKKTQDAINETNKNIEKLGGYTIDLYDSLTAIQKLFDKIRNVPSEGKLQYEICKKQRLNWKQQAEKIEKIYQMGFTDEELEYVFHKNAAHLWSME